MTGGRRDLTYSVACAHCSEGQCVPCGEKIRFEPGPADLRETRVVVTDLDAHLNYTFTVEAHSGVSQFSSGKAVASITTALDHTGELGPTPALRFLFLQMFDPECSGRLEGRGLGSGVWSHPLSPQGSALLSLGWDESLTGVFLSVSQIPPR